MSATPPEFVILWPIIRRPLSGHIVRQPNGNLAEWFPLPSEWPAPPSSGERPKEILQFQEATDSNPGWILLEHRGEPTFAKASTLANQPGKSYGSFVALPHLSNLRSTKTRLSSIRSSCFVRVGVSLWAMAFRLRRGVIPPPKTGRRPGLIFCRMGTEFMGR